MKRCGRFSGQVRLPRYRVCLSTIYACGLRLQEGINLRVSDIDSARMMIHVRHGKGAKDRYVPLPLRTLAIATSVLEDASPSDAALSR